VNGITVTSTSKEGKKGAGRRERRIKSHVRVNNDRKEEKRQIERNVKRRKKGRKKRY